jgi:hypothetical protein
MNPHSVLLPCYQNWLQMIQPALPSGLPRHGSTNSPPASLSTIPTPTFLPYRQKYSPDNRRHTHSYTSHPMASNNQTPATPPNSTMGYSSTHSNTTIVSGGTAFTKDNCTMLFTTLTESIELQNATMIKMMEMQTARSRCSRSRSRGP